MNSTDTGESVDPTLQAINAVLNPKTRAPCSLLLFRDPLTASNFSLVRISVSAHYQILDGYYGCTLKQRLYTRTLCTAV